jgi:hypothetical protein
MRSLYVLRKKNRRELYKTKLNLPPASAEVFGVSASCNSFKQIDRYHLLHITELCILQT